MLSNLSADSFNQERQEMPMVFWSAVGLGQGVGNRDPSWQAYQQYLTIPVPETLPSVMLPNLSMDSFNKE